MIPDIKELTFEEMRHEYRVSGKPIQSVSHFLTPISNQVYSGINHEVMNAAAQRGTAVHFAIELYNTYCVTEIDEENKPYMDAYIAWFDKHKPSNLHEEKRTYHPTYWYAGTSDLICTIDGELWLIDYKTVATLQAFLVAPQLAAYAKAWQAHGVPVKRVAALHLKKNGTYAFSEFPIEESFSTFLECLSLQNYIDENMRK